MIGLTRKGANGSGMVNMPLQLSIFKNVALLFFGYFVGGSFYWLLTLRLQLYAD